MDNKGNLSLNTSEIKVPFEQNFLKIKVSSNLGENYQTLLQIEVCILVNKQGLVWLTAAQKDSVSDNVQNHR